MSGDGPPPPSTSWGSLGSLAGGGSPRKRGRHCCPPQTRCHPHALGGKDSHDFISPRVHHHDPVVDENVLIIAPFRINGHDFARQPMERNATARNADAGPDL